MNLDFSGLKGGRDGARLIGLDLPQLVAMVAAAQSASPTAVAACRREAQRRSPVSAPVALIAVIEGGTGWMQAIAMLGGSFHPDAATHLGNLP